MDRTGTFYSAAASIHGYGAQLMMGDGTSPEQFEAIAAIRNIQFGSMDTKDINNTHLRSPDAHEEHKPGMRDSGAFQCEAIWLPEEESQSNAGGGSGPFSGGGIIAKWRARTTHNFKIVLDRPGSPNAIEWEFSAYVSKFQPGTVGKDDIIMATIGFQPTQAYDAALP